MYPSSSLWVTLEASAPGFGLGVKATYAAESLAIAQGVKTVTTTMKEKDSPKAI